MKGILEFNLDEFEDQLKFETCNKSIDLSLIIWNLDQWLRDNYQNDKGDISVDNAETVRNKLREIMSNYSLDFNSKIFN